MKDDATSTPLRFGPLSVRYGRRAVVQDITGGPFVEGSLTTLLGPNGSGKSTLLRALAGLTRCTGPVMLGDLDLTALSLPNRARHCAYMPQTLPPTIRMQAVEAVLVSMHAGKVRTDGNGADFEQALSILERLGIIDLAQRHLDELSGGQRQLIGLAQALARSPKLLLLDEPLSALDLRHQFRVMDLLQRETVARSMVTVMVLHDLGLALRKADTAMLLAHGGVVAEGTPRDVITAVHLQAAFGIRARIEESGDGTPMVLVEGAE